MVLAAFRPRFADYALKMKRGAQVDLPEGPRPDPRRTPTCIRAPACSRPARARARSRSRSCAPSGPGARGLLRDARRASGDRPPRTSRISSEGSRRGWTCGRATWRWPRRGERSTGASWTCPEPWQPLEALREVLEPGGIVCAYLPTTSRSRSSCSALHAQRVRPHRDVRGAPPELARDRAQRPPGPPDGGPHRIPHDRPSPGAGGLVRARAGEDGPKPSAPTCRRRMRCGTRARSPCADASEGRDRLRRRRGGVEMADPIRSSGALRASRPTSCATQVKFLEDEIAPAAPPPHQAPRQVKILEERLLETKGELSRAMAQNEKLADALRAEKERIEALKRRGRQALPAPRPPSACSSRANDDGSLDVLPRAARCASTSHPIPSTTTGPQGVEVDPQRGAQRRGGPGARGRPGRGREGQGAARGRPGAIWSAAATRSSSPTWPGSLSGEPVRAGRRRPVRPAVRLRARAPPEGGGRGARPRGDPRRHLRGHRRPRGPDRAHP